MGCEWDDSWIKIPGTNAGNFFSGCDHLEEVNCRFQHLSFGSKNCSNITLDAYPDTFLYMDIQVVTEIVARNSWGEGMHFHFAPTGKHFLPAQ